MRFLEALFPYFGDFVEVTYGGGLTLHDPPKGEPGQEELARGFLEGRFLSVEKSGPNYLIVISNDKEWLEKELNVNFSQYLEEVLKENENECIGSDSSQIERTS